MAQAVKKLYPKAKLGIGPSIKSGFYYDFDVEKPFTPEDLVKIEKEMKKIIARDCKFERQMISKKDALKLFKKQKEAYKVELINALPDEDVSIYTDGDFTDLCKGPHVESTGQIKAFKLLSVAGAYWHGVETNPMLQRIYGTAFLTDKELRKYLNLIKEAEKRDHRKLGKQLELFSFHQEMGAGLVLYHPKGAMLRTTIEDWLKKEHIKRGYQLVISPHILKSDIWVQSGHYEYYKDMMYTFKIEGQEYAVKPMNCPGHILVYNSTTRSYKDLPLRLFELGSVYRHEKGGVLHGLLRVRGFTQDDAHIFCLQEHLADEIVGVLDFIIDALKAFGFKDFSVEISTRPAKSIGSDEYWQKAQDALETALKQKGLTYSLCEGEGAFYGPKIDIKLKDALDRDWQCATIQCDFALPERFNLSYIDAEGKKKRPVMLHRVILGSMERFMGALVEHYAGALPVWLAPMQAVIIPVANTFNDYAYEVKSKLADAGIRVEVDARTETLNYRIRDNQVQKVPYMLIVGEKEKAAGSVSVRSRAAGNEGAMATEKFVDRIKKEVKSYS